MRRVSQGHHRHVGVLDAEQFIGRRPVHGLEQCAGDRRRRGEQDGVCRVRLVAPAAIACHDIPVVATRTDLLHIAGGVQHHATIPQGGHECPRQGAHTSFEADEDRALPRPHGLATVGQH